VIVTDDGEKAGAASLGHALAVHNGIQQRRAGCNGDALSGGSREQSIAAQGDTEAGFGVL
jgi:hypothetical protein